MSSTVVQQQSFPIGQQQPSVIQLQTVHSHTATTTNNGRSAEYNPKAAVVTGIIQIVAGAVVVILGVLALCISTHYRIAWSIWGGICFYIGTGVIGVISRSQNRCLIIAYMVMSIISAVCAGGQLIYDSVAASTQSRYCLGDPYYNTYYCSWPIGVVIVHSFAAVVGFLEMIVAIVASAYCCGGSCGANAAQSMVIHYAQPYTGGQVTIVTPGSYPSGPAVINPSQSYGMGPYTQPHYMGQMGEPIGQGVGSTRSTQYATTPSPDQPYRHPIYSPPAYSYTQPASTVPVPLDPEPRPDTAFK